MLTGDSLSFVLLVGDLLHPVDDLIDGSLVGRAVTPDEVGAVAALLMGPEGRFNTGSDFLMDGGATTAYRFGEVPEVR